MASMSKVIRGLQILAKYAHPGDGNVEAQHDEIFATGPCDVAPEDASELHQLGWHWDANVGSWRRYT